MHHFTPISALIGGLLIGVAAALMLLLKGRIAGISGILGGLLHPSAGDASWRVLFLVGMLTREKVTVWEKGNVKMTIVPTAGAGGGGVGMVGVF